MQVSKTLLNDKSKSIYSVSLQTYHDKALILLQNYESEKKKTNEFQKQNNIQPNPTLKDIADCSTETKVLIEEITEPLNSLNENLKQSFKKEHILEQFIESMNALTDSTKPEKISEYQFEKILTFISKINQENFYVMDKQTIVLNKKQIDKKTFCNKIAIRKIIKEELLKILLKLQKNINDEHKDINARKKVLYEFLFNQNIITKIHPTKVPLFLSTLMNKNGIANQKINKEISNLKKEVSSLKKKNNEQQKTIDNLKQLIDEQKKTLDHQNDEVKKQKDKTQNFIINNQISKNNYIGKIRKLQDKLNKVDSYASKTAKNTAITTGTAGLVTGGISIAGAFTDKIPDIAIKIATIATVALILITIIALCYVVKKRINNKPAQINNTTYKTKENQANSK